MNSRRVVVHILLLILQMILINYLDFSPYVFIVILPVMIYNLPATTSTLNAVLIAFFSGLAIDLFCDGIIGLNAMALTPVAFVRKTVFNLFLGKELSSRKTSLTVKEVGFGKVFICLTFFITIYLGLYIWIDGASVRPLSYNLLRFFLSLGASLIVSLPLTSYSNLDLSKR